MTEYMEIRITNKKGKQYKYIGTRPEIDPDRLITFATKNGVEVAFNIDQVEVMTLGALGEDPWQAEE